MPRYFFHLHDDVVAHDEEGTDLPDLAAARLHAIHGARGIIADQVKRGHFTLSHHIRIVGAERGEALTVAFGDAVDVRA